MPPSLARGISLPHYAGERRNRGKIAQAGWAIWYLFGSDEGDEYLDFFASHRMTNDRHVRVHADGRCKDLSAISEFSHSSEDPEEDARLEAGYHAENRKVVWILEEKRLGLGGDEPGGVLLNRFLHY